MPKKKKATSKKKSSANAKAPVKGATVVRNDLV